MNDDGRQESDPRPSYLFAGVWAPFRAPGAPGRAAATAKESDEGDTVRTEGEYRFPSRLPGRAYGVVGVFVLGSAAYGLLMARSMSNPVPIAALSVFLLVMSGWNLYVFFNRKRPVITITGATVTSRSIARRHHQSIRLAEIERIGQISRIRRRLPVFLRNGEVESLPLRELKPADQREVVRILESVLESADATDDRHEG